MLIARGHVDLNNDVILERSYQFINEHKLEDRSDHAYGQLDGRLSSVVMALYLIQNNLTHLMPHNWEEFKPLVDVIKTQSNGESIKRSWFNILPKNKGLLEHNHTNSRTTQNTKYAAFVYYPQLTHDTPIELLVNDQWTPIPAQSGDWLCFSFDTLHRVPPNNSDSHRISFAFNV